LKRGHHFPVFFIPKKLMLKGFVIVLVLMPFSNKKSTIDLQRKYVYKVLLCILKRSCPRTFGLLFDLCSFVPKHLALQYLKAAAGDFSVQHEKWQSFYNCFSFAQFMKRSKERTEVEIENEERQAIYANHITTAMRDQGSRFVSNPSFASVEDLNFGRMAFLGMNSEIEQMQADRKAVLEEKEALKREKDVGDEEMALTLSQMKTPMTTPPVAVPTKLMSDSEAEELLKKGGNLLHKIKNKSGGKDWKKNKKFLKPKD